jgi:hypothetical protein
MDANAHCRVVRHLFRTRYSLRPLNKSRNGSNSLPPRRTERVLSPPPPVTQVHLRSTSSSRKGGAQGACRPLIFLCSWPVLDFVHEWKPYRCRCVSSLRNQLLSPPVHIVIINVISTYYMRLMIMYES